jgi:hypothetical protein
MFETVHIAALDRVLMKVIQLLAHDCVGFDELRMIAFFSDLIGGFRFMGAFKQG